MTDPIAALSEALKDRYRLERELGRGGMAIVWLAHDLRHDRPVALKVLRPQLAAALGAERFQREIRLAARLQHPHILSVFDSGEAEGLLWFTMPYVRGESLRDRMAREGRLSVDEAFRITREAAQALQYAHGEGIIHRDVKPENILLTEDGSTLVADFGIARHVDGGGSMPRLTETGLAIGTPAYMSPEQAMGERSTDARTDQYALATVCWEMLAGALPFSGPTPAAVIASRLTTAAPSVRTARADVTEPQDQVIRRALAIRADDRFASIGDFARALRTESTPPAATAAVPVPRPTRRRTALLLTLLAGALLAGAGLFAARRMRAPAPTADGDRRLAVLPFANLGDTADAYFADGVTDAVRGKLTALPALTVIATASSNEYRASTKPAAQIARELGVRYLLTGQVRWAKGGGTERVQVSPELVEITADGTPASRWQQPFDATITDVFAVQGDIAGKVAQQLGVALGGGARAELAAQPTRNLAAYDAYLRGRAVPNQFTIRGVRESIRFFELATSLDSTFGEAWGALSHKLTLSILLIAPDSAMARRAVDAAERGERYAPGNTSTVLARTAYALAVRGDADEALAVITRALPTAPNSAEIVLFHALALREVGRREESIAEFERARALDPRSLQVAEELAHTLVTSRRFAEAEKEADQGLLLDSTNLRLFEYKATARLGVGDFEGARRITVRAAALTNPVDVAVHFAVNSDRYWLLDEPSQRLLTTLGNDPFGAPVNRTIVLAQLYNLRGDRARSRLYADSSAAMFAAQLRANPGDVQRTGLLGLALALAGQRDSAARTGERAVQLSGGGWSASYTRQLLARIHTLIGDRQAALDDLEQLLTIPSDVTPAFLAIDPNYASLRNEPRFQKLVAAR